MTRTVGGRTIVLDRRRFLQLAAATGLAAAGSGRLMSSVLAQSPRAAPATDPIADLAASLGHDIERIFGFVRDEIRYEPYPGSLRGARGTLLARAGSSADQAVLLAGLLASSSVPVRYVTGSLEPAAIQALMATAVVDAAAARREIEQAVLSEADIAAGLRPDIPTADRPADAGLSPEVMARILEVAEADQEMMGQVAKDQLERTIEQLGVALASVGVTLPLGVSSMPEPERTRHVWVQADPGSGWLDMDPSLPSVVPGGGVGAAAVATLDALPDDLRHRVVFSVLAESFVGGGLTQSAILEWGAFADQLAYQGVALGFVRPEAAPDVNFLGAGLSDGATYVPALFVDDTAFLSPTAISIATGGGGGGLFGGFGGGGEGLVEGETTAVWLEVRVTVPGAEPRIARRQVFDRIGRTTRESGVVDPYAIPPAELVDLGPGEEGEYPPCGKVFAFSVSGGTTNLKALIEGVDYRLPGVGSLLAAGWQVTRDELRSELADTTGCLPFDDAPSVVAWVVTPTPEGPVLSTDIYHRTFGTVSLSDRAPGAAPALLAGVLGHVAERMAAGDGLPSGDLDGSFRVSVGSLFQMALDQGIPLRALMGEIPQGLSLDAESTALIGAAVESGSIVVVPERPLDVGGSPRLGWWVIDPLTGQAVDQLDTGGGAVTEDTIVQVVDSAESAAARSLSQLQAHELGQVIEVLIERGTLTTIRGMRILERVMRFAAVRLIRGG